MTTGVDSLDAAREALARARWQEACDLATAAPSSVLRLETLADATWWLGRVDECIEHREAAYRAHDESGDHRRAGRCAAWLVEHHWHRGRPAMAGAWLRRARRHLADDPECPEHGYLLLRETEAAHGTGDLAVAVAHARAAVSLGRRLQNPDLEAEALQALGRVMIESGDHREGLALLDEAMLLGTEGRLGPYTTGKVYCSLIGACKELGDVRRAAEWTDATSRWAEHHPLAVFPGLCRVHRAATLDWRGELVSAEQEAVLASEELLATHLPAAATAFAEVGDIRRRLGDLAGAEVAFARSQELCGGPCAGVALLRLAQGRVDAARALIDRCVESTASPLGRAWLLPALAQIAIAGGDRERAQQAADELEQFAAAVGTSALSALAAVARGRVLLASGDGTAAVAALQSALTQWQALEVPYEVATAWALLAVALRAGGDHDAAAEAFAAAEAGFERIGAALDARQLRDRSAPSSYPAGLTAREVEVLRLIAEGRTNKELAAELHLSEKTVSRHLSNIFTKIGVSTRTAAAAFAFEQELVER